MDIIPQIPTVLFPEDYPLTQGTIAAIRRVYGAHTVVRTTYLVPEGYILAGWLPEVAVDAPVEDHVIDQLLRGVARATPAVSPDGTPEELR